MKSKKNKLIHFITPLMAVLMIAFFLLLLYVVVSALFTDKINSMAKASKPGAKTAAKKETTAEPSVKRTHKPKVVAPPETIPLAQEEPAPTIADQAREEVLKTVVVETQQEAKEPAPAKPWWTSLLHLWNTVTGPQKWLYIGLAAVAFIALLLFTDTCNSPKYIAKRGDKEAEKKEQELNRLRDSLAHLEIRKRESDSIATTALVFAKAAEDETTQALRNKQITDQQAVQIRSTIKQKTHEIAVQISTAPLRELDSLRDVFLLARRFNKSAD